MERRAAELPAEIESARKDVQARHADLLDCLRRDCFSAEARPSPPSDAGAEESCKACSDNANRVAELTAQLVRLNEVAAQLDSQIPARETALKEAVAAHGRDTLNPPLVVVQKSREVLGFLEDQRDTLQDAIKALEAELDKAQKALEDCRAKNCPSTTAVTPPPRPPPPSCAKCEGLEKQIAADRDEVARLKSVRETFEQAKLSLAKQEQDNKLQPPDKSFIDAATKRLAEIDADLKRLDDEIADLNTKLERCKNEPCAEIAGRCRHGEEGRRYGAARDTDQEGAGQGIEETGPAAFQEGEAIALAERNARRLSVAGGGLWPQARGRKWEVPS